MRKYTYDKPSKYKKKKQKDSAFNLVILLLGIMIVLAFLTGCAQQPIIKEVKVPVPCEVSNIPKEPAKLNLEEATIGQIMTYIKQVVKYTKELKPLINNCITEKKITTYKEAKTTSEGLSR